jgi:hypothetical protein
MENSFLSFYSTVKRPKGIQICQGNCSSGNSRKTTYQKLTYEEVAHSLQKHFKI